MDEKENSPGQVDDLRTRAEEALCELMNPPAPPRKQGGFGVRERRVV